MGRRPVLTFAYQLRALGFTVVLLSMGIAFLGIPPLGIGPLLIGVILVGFSWNATVTVTAAYASDRFGISNLGSIYGMMFAVMPIGSGLLNPASVASTSASSVLTELAEVVFTSSSLRREQLVEVCPTSVSSRNRELRSVNVTAPSWESCIRRLGGVKAP